MKYELGNYKVVKRDLKGRYSRGISKIKLVLIVAVLAAIGGIIYCGEVYLPKQLDAARDASTQMIPVAEAATITPEVLTPSMLEEMKGDVLDRLAKCENKDHKAIVFDSNGKASVGDFQFQVATFQTYWLKKTGAKLSEKEAVVAALDDVKARELAEWIIFETNDKVSANWFNCDKWNGLQILVDFIKAHSN